jgi:hypothetical protein
MVATNSGQDDDQNAMLEIFGSTRIGGGYTSVFWNSPKTMTFIDTHIKNPALFESLSGATNGAIVHFVFS